MGHQGWRNGGMRRGWSLGLALCGLLTACMHGQLAGLPTPVPNEPVGELVVIRTSSVVGATNSFLITIDGRRA